MKKLTTLRRRIMKLRMIFIPDGPFGDRARGKLYEPYLLSFGANFKVASQSFIFNPNGLKVGNHVYIGFNSYLGQGEIELEDEVLIGNFVSITASNHLMENNSFRFGGYHAEKIKIGKGTWIGAGSSITAGVTIGKACLVATGAVVTKAFEDKVIIGGVPAKIIGNTDEFNKKHEK